MNILNKKNKEQYSCAVLCLVSQSRLTLWDPVDCSPPGSSVHGGSPGQNPGVGCHALLQGIFPTQRSNPGLLHCRLIVSRLRHQGSLPNLKTYQIGTSLVVQWLTPGFQLREHEFGPQSGNQIPHAATKGLHAATQDMPQPNR